MCKLDSHFQLNLHCGTVCVSMPVGCACQHASWALHSCMAQTKDWPKCVINLSSMEMTVGVEMADTFLLNCNVQHTVATLLKTWSELPLSGFS